jgi:sugar lactone lactonase YvrE
VVYVADSQNHRIQRFDAGGIYELKWGSQGSGNGQFDQPVGVAVSPSGLVYASDQYNNRMQRFSAAGLFHMAFGSQGSYDGQFEGPYGAAVSPAGRVYVADRLNHRIQRFDIGGRFQTKWGSRGSGDGEFHEPMGVAVSPAGMVYVADGLNCRIQRFFDSEAWVSGTNEFVDPAVGPVDVGVGAGRMFGPALTLETGMGLVVGGTMTVHTGGALTVDGGTIEAGRLALAAGGSLTAVGNVNGKLSGAGGSVITALGPVAIGDAAAYAAFNHGGTLDVGGHIVVLNTQGFAALGELTTLDGGRIIAVYGVSLGGGDNLVGSGTVSAKVAAAVGSSIVAEGDLALGQDGSLAGFVSDGELHVNSHTVTLHDADLAVLGSLTTIGHGATGGALAAPNGSLLGFGRDFSGYGVVNGSFVNNGNVHGGTAGATLEFLDLVTGVGDFHNSVTFSGGYSPGLSAAEVDLDDVTFSATNTLTIELGGPAPGSDFDRLNVNGSAALDGALDIALINAFAPQVGDVFEIISYGSHTGKFASTAGWDLGQLALVRLYQPSRLLLHTAWFGDANLDGKVDVFDLAILANNYGVPGPKEWTDADFTGEGDVDVYDLAALANNYGLGTAGTTIPEPATLALLAIGAGAGVRRRARHDLERRR